MPSFNAKAVAKEVIATVRKGEKVNMQKIQRKHGYSKFSAAAMKATKTKAFKDEIKPIIDQLEAERQRAVSLMKKRISKAKYRDLVDGMDKLTKNIQLLGGKTTENVKHTISDLLNEIENER